MPPPKNDDQELAIAHVNGPMEVLAGPGSGKTYTIVRRLIHLIEKARIPPEKILVITFTKAAALEMQSRFLREIRRSYSSVNFGTFHSIYYQILIRSNAIKDALLVTSAQQIEIVRKILHSLFPGKVFGEAEYKEILGAISLRKNDEQQSVDATPRFPEIFDEYVELLQAAGKIDFDDMILRCHGLFMNNEKLLRMWQDSFSQIIVDEFQDINRLQYRVLKKLAAPRNNLFIVGDDDQSIYGFRGADPLVMQEFLADYPDCQLVTLKINYRSHAEIVEHAKKVVAENTLRLPKDYRALREGKTPSVQMFASRQAEDAFLLGELRAMTDDERDNTAVILRTNFEVKGFSAMCLKAGIALKTWQKPQEVFSHFLAIDIYDYLAFADGARERGRFLSIINKPFRYLSRKCVANLSGVVSEQDILAYYEGNGEAQNEVRRFFQDIRRIAKMPPFLAINFIRKGVGYERYLKEKAKQNEFGDWQKVLDRLLASAKGFDTHSEWLAHCRGEKDKEEDAAKSQSCLAPRSGLNVITLHSSKGLEFDTVFLPHLNEGTLPGNKALSDPQIEEERRLFYVGMTRAKERLLISCAASVKYTPSRFLEPIL